MPSQNVASASQMDFKSLCESFHKGYQDLCQAIERTFAQNCRRTRRLFVWWSIVSSRFVRGTNEWVRPRGHYGSSARGDILGFFQRG
jgi:hypothetical protein